MSKIKTIFQSPFSGALLGLLVFFLYFSPAILNPATIDFLTEGDPASSFLGWHFFRQETWHLPLGRFDKYATDLGVSLIFADSIPLLAFIFKPFSAWLPANFQYHGLWVLLCYILQGAFAWSLIQLKNKNFLIKVLGSLFFILSPILFCRFQFQHFALMAHWLILAALYLYFRQKTVSNWLWLGLILISALTHAYLFLMVVLLWGGFLVKEYWIERRINLKKGLTILATNLSAILLVFWLVGYFTVPLSATTSQGDSTEYSLNLIAPINPLGWSVILHGYHIARPGQYEGCNYLGAGMVLLFFIAFYELLTQISRRRRQHIPVLSAIRRWLFRYSPLLLVSAFFFLAALSPTITWQKHTLFSYDPLFLNKFFSTFRASGRLFWPVYYLIMLALIWVVISRRSRLPAIGILLVALLIQIKDITPKTQEVMEQFSQVKTWQNPLVSNFWESRGANYRHIQVVPGDNLVPGYFPLGYFAANHNLIINVGAFARIDSAKLDRANKKMRQQFKEGELDPETLYVIRDKFDQAKIAPSIKEQYRFQEIDDYTILIKKEDSFDF